MAVSTAQLDTMRAGINQLHNTQMDERIASLREDIRAFEERVRSRELQILDYLATMRGKTREIETIQATQDTDTWRSNLIAGVERLATHPRVESMGVYGSEIRITTTRDIRLTRTDTGESRWLGAFRVGIDLTVHRVTMINLDTPRQGRDHPHITDGSPCFGGHAEDFGAIQVAGQIDVLFELLLQYLETLNMADSYGAYAGYWFDFPDQEAEILGLATTEEVLA